MTGLGASGSYILIVPLLQGGRGPPKDSLYMSYSQCFLHSLMGMSSLLEPILGTLVSSRGTPMSTVRSLNKAKTDITVAYPQT